MWNAWAAWSPSRTAAVMAIVLLVAMSGCSGDSGDAARDAAPETADLAPAPDSDADRDADRDTDRDTDRDVIGDLAPGLDIASDTTGNDGGGVTDGSVEDGAPPLDASQTDGVSMCGEGGRSCGGTCVYTGRDPSNCGGCGVTCQADAPVCMAGRCQSYPGVRLALGVNHTCAILNGGKVRCWGEGQYGRLGYGNTNDIGDDETPASAGDVNVGGTVIQIGAGTYHTCALLDTGKVRCWGQGQYGELGYGNTNDIGDNETPASAGDVDVGGRVVQISVGYNHACALLEGGKVRCWGNYGAGKLGYGNSRLIGDDESPASAGDVDVGGFVVQVAAGGAHTCALLDTGRMRCWGFAAAGALGYGNEKSIGDDETPASAGDVHVGGNVLRIAAGGQHTCVLLDDGGVRCWGNGMYGTLGYGNSNDIGDTETPDTVGELSLGGSAIDVRAGSISTCALLSTGALRCWGNASYGVLGYGNKAIIGDDELPSAAGDVGVGGSCSTVEVGGSHACAVLTGGAVRCWGNPQAGQLGYGNLSAIGDDELPSAAGDVPLN